MRFLVEKNADGELSWWLVDSDGARIAWAGVSFANMIDANKAAEGFRLAARDLDYRLDESGPASWQWQAWAGSTCVAESVNRFPTETEAMAAAQHVREHLRMVPSP